MQRAFWNKQNQLKKPTFCFILTRIGVFSFEVYTQNGKARTNAARAEKKIATW